MEEEEENEEEEKEEKEEEEKEGEEEVYIVCTAHPNHGESIARQSGGPSRWRSRFPAS